MKRWNWLKSMRTKVLVFCAISTLLALGLQTVFFQYSSSKLIYDQARDASWNSMKNMQDDIYSYIKSIEGNILKIYNDSEFISDLANGESMSNIRIKNSSLAHTFAVSEFETSQYINAVYIYDIKDNLISSYRHASTPKYTYPTNIYNASEQNNADIVKKYVGSDKKDMLISSYYNKSREKNIIRFVLKLYYENGSRKIGYVVCDVDEKSFLKIINKYIYSSRQILWLQPMGDRPIIEVGELSDKQKEYYNNAINMVKSNTWGIAKNITSGNEFFEIKQSKYNLVAFSLTPQSLLETNQQVLNRNLLIIAILIILVFFIASIIISNNLTIPLKNMVLTMDKIKKGDTSLRLSNLSKDEIGILGENFNQMLDQIEKLIFEEYQSKLLVNTSKFKALQAQVNPHFLYNTLDTMSGIAASQNCEEVSKLCIALSNIFRYSIDMIDPLSTVQNEIKHIKNYMYVMNTRMQNSIELNIEIDDEFLQDRIPRISIQPLVENSIQHGLKNKRGDKKISISCIRDDEKLILTVSDNGTGMDAEKINSILQNPEEDVLEKGSSIGLSNIDTRVKILFGNEYGVRVESEDNAGSSVSICIPRMEGSSEGYEKI